jgi:hypothetical protein
LLEFQMMMRTSRRHLGLPALLALLLIGAWVCIGVVHEHDGSPTCQICNALQGSAAVVVTPVALVEPTVAVQPLTPTPLPAAATPTLSTPPGRAPPLA